MFRIRVQTFTSYRSQVIVTCGKRVIAWGETSDKYSLMRRVQIANSNLLYTSDINLCWQNASNLTKRREAHDS